MRVSIGMMNGAQLGVVEVDPSELVGELRKKAAALAEKLVWTCRLVLGDAVLDVGVELSAQGVTDDAEVKLVVVHTPILAMVELLAEYSCTLFSVTSGESLVTLAGHVGVVNGAAFSPGGHVVATCSDDSSCKIWSSERGECLKALWHKDCVKSAVFSRDGRLVATICADGSCKSWDVESGNCLQRLGKEHTDDASVVSAAFSLDGRLLATAFDDDICKVFDVANKSCLTSIRGSEYTRVLFASLCPDASLLLTAFDDHTCKICSTENGKSCIALKEFIVSAAFSLDGRLVATVSPDFNGRNDCKIWRTEDGKCVGNLKGTAASTPFMLDGLPAVVTATSNVTSCKLLNVESGECLRTFESNVASPVFALWQ